MPKKARKYEMIDEIYRFRRLENLLGSHQELTKQEIYFAAPEQLNDPMEGYRDIFWRGDQIIWENFLINYLRCLSHVFLLYLIVGEENKFSQNDFPLSPYGLMNTTPQSQIILDKIK